MRRVIIGVGCVVCAILAARPLAMLGASLAMKLQPVVNAGFDPVDFVRPIEWWAYPVLFSWCLALTLPLITGEAVIFLASRRLLRQP